MQSFKKTQHTADTMTQKLNTDSSLQGWWTRTTGYNMPLEKKRVQCLNEAFPLDRDKSCFVSSFVVADCLVLRNPIFRQAKNRYMQGSVNQET